MATAAKNKTYSAVIEELESQGWELEMTANGHWKAKPPSGRELVVFAESHDHHAYLNTVRKLRDSGLQWPPPSKAERASQRRREQAGEVEPVVRSTPFPPEPMDQPEPKLHLVTPAAPAAHAPQSSGADRLFEDLKEARDYCRLATEHEAECEARLAALQAEVDAARAERERAVEQLRSKKSAFDRAFEAT